jgi:hypothetical protein
LATLIRSARMRGLLHGSHASSQHAAAIRAGDRVGLVTLTLDGRVVWLPGALSEPTQAPKRIDLTDLSVFDALTVVFRRPRAA